MKSKVSFDIAYGGYKNEQKNIHFICEVLIKREVVETSEVVKTCPAPPSSFSAPNVEKTRTQPAKKEKSKARV